MNFENYLRIHMPVEYLRARYGEHFTTNDSWGNHIGKAVLVEDSGCGGLGNDIRRLTKDVNKSGELTVSFLSDKKEFCPNAVIHGVIPLSNVLWIVHRGLAMLNLRKLELTKQFEDSGISPTMANYYWGRDSIRQVWSYVCTLAMDSRLKFSGDSWQEFRKNDKLDYQCDMEKFRKEVIYEEL